MNKTSKIINNLRKAGYNKDADVLEKSLNGEYSETYFGIKMAQLEETPFIPTREKLKKYNPQTDKEKTWQRGVLPMPKQQRDKALKDPKFQSEIENLGGEAPISLGVPYRDPESIGGTTSVDQIIERLKTQGRPAHGINIPGKGNVLDVDPAHPIDEIGARGGIKYNDAFDLNEGAGIGYIPEGTNQYIYEQQENLDPGLVDIIHKVWGEGVGQFAMNVESAMDRFNKRLESWVSDDQNQMLATNFMTQLNQVVTGSRDIKNVWEANPKGENLSAVIMKRMENVKGIRDNTIAKAQKSEKYSDLQAELYTKYLDDLNSGKDYPSENWLNKLMLVYGQDPRKGSGEEKSYTMDIIADNPLDIKYPESFIENIILPYNETKRKSSGGGYERETKEPSWEDILSRNFQPITVGAEETARRRKMIEDVDMWKGLVGTGGKPLITGQKDIIIFQYNQELVHLSELLGDLQRMLNVKERFASSKLADAESNPQAIEAMKNAVIKFARTLEQKYKQGELVTKEGKLHGSYSVGSETKLEIYLKALYILQAFEAWIKAVGGDMGPVDAVTGKEEPNLGDLERIEADETMLPKSAYSYQDMVKIAYTLDHYGLHKQADMIERMTKGQ